jgi:hypothetical protein
LGRNLVKHSIPSLVLKRSVGIMLCSSSCRMCLCSSLIIQTPHKPWNIPRTGIM